MIVMIAKCRKQWRRELAVEETDEEEEGGGRDGV